MGYEKLREEIFANQKRLGVIPENTQLTPWPAEMPKWDSLSLVQKKLYARQAEVFAGYAAYTDSEIGRVIQAVEDMGKLDNTLIIYICGDNGTSPEGTLSGTFNQTHRLQRHSEPPEVSRCCIMKTGARTRPIRTWRWHGRGRSIRPFKWTKQVASHFGGTRQGMAISWPGHIKDVGAIRTQFHHVIDIVPTILEATGIQAPAMVNGIKQKPIEGVSMAYTFDQANAKAPSKRDTQYFEMVGNRGDLPRRLDRQHDAVRPALGLWPRASCPMSSTATNGNSTTSPKTSRKTTTSPTKNPDKLKEMQALFLTEAAKYKVFPLDNTAFSRLLTPRPSAVAGRTVFTYTGENAGIPVGNAPDILDKDYTITAEVTIPEGGAEGMIVTLGGRFGGYGLYLLKGKPVFVYNLLDLKRYPLGGRHGGRSARTCLAVRSSRASTRSCSTSNTTAPAPARVAPACSRWMARSWPARRSRTRFRS